MPPAGLPDAKTLIGAARAAMAAIPGLPAGPEDGGTARARAKAETAARRHEAASTALDQWAPAIDEMTDLAGAARFLGLKGPDSLRRRKFRIRADGTREWPGPDATFGRSAAWKYRTIVIHQAAAPGRGHPGATLGRTNQHRRKQPGP
jgi:hypothetical protein